MELLIPLILALGLMMFLATRKQKKAVQAQQSLQDSLAEGDRVMTTSGLYATVADTSDDTTINLEIADGVVTTWLRQAVREKVGPVADEYDEDLDESEDVDTSDVDEADGEGDDEKAGAKVAPPLEHGTK